MCGITGYVGSRPGVRTVIDMLRRLEYRSYDSAGVAIAQGSEVEIIKTAGKLAVLESQLQGYWDRQGQKSASLRPKLMSRRLRRYI